MAVSNVPLPEKRIRSIAADEADLFPALKTWRDNKLRELSYCLATFFNYLSKPRENRGFAIVSNNPADLLAVQPRITREMTSYLISEIFPCPAMIKESRFTVFRAPLEIAQAIEINIENAIANKSLLRPMKKVVKDQGMDKSVSVALSIQPGVVQTIWTYLSNGIDGLAYGATSNKDVIDKLGTAEAIVLDRRNGCKNYGFNDDIENCAFQTILYIIVALTDWLETDRVGKSEVTTAYKLIYPTDLQKSLKQTKNPRFADIISEAFVSKDLIPGEKAIGLISTMMVDVGYHMNNLKDRNSARIINRYMGLAQPI